ncbi:hypothetical protein BZA05DRAFT_393465 [Tricharina praecox]|uniref:uncharacterized protein n=1 Tax=Tricharina praecox TaxID=43433 RepID=UPI00221F1CB7|nr:uncharacterized protein BZA05DRAFT_393465 [Tricharina praecox]KAI5854182.1 hypothetical protein BZA05DRAFT_393465 [Tricharina praecox]
MIHIAPSPSPPPVNLNFLSFCSYTSIFPFSLFPFFPFLSSPSNAFPYVRGVLFYSIFLMFGVLYFFFSFLFL